MPCSEYKDLYYPTKSLKRDNMNKFGLLDSDEDIYLPWWPSCLDRGALNNVDAPGFGTSVVRGPTGHK